MLLRWAAEQKATRALSVLAVWLSEQTRRRGLKIVTKGKVIIKPGLLRMPLKENKQAVRDKRERASIEIELCKDLVDRRQIGTMLVVVIRIGSNEYLE